MKKQLVTVTRVNNGWIVDVHCEMHPHTLVCPTWEEVEEHVRKAAFYPNGKPKPS